MGGNTFGPPRLDEAQTVAVIHAALDLGVNFVDTAIGYGEGHSEEFIGKALGNRRDEMVIATKFNLRNLGDQTVEQRIKAHAEESLRKLNTDRIDLLQIHQPSPSTPPEQILKPLDDLVRAGKVRAIGASQYSSWRLAEAEYIARELGAARFVTVQNYYHLFARANEAEVEPFCAAYNVSILPYHPLGGGFLTGKYHFGEPPPKGSRGDVGSGIIDAMTTEENWKRLGEIDKWCADHGHGIGELAIAWLIANPQVGSVIAGVSNVEQLTANVSAASWVLTPEEKAEVEAIVSPSGVPGPEKSPYGAGGAGPRNRQQGAN
jgi:aryl-alcohol dehydrogenase-like predicted oxidoreductase